MTNFADELRAAAVNTQEIEDLVRDFTTIVPTILDNQLRILEAIAAIPGAADVTEIRNDVQTLIDNLIPTA